MGSVRPLSSVSRSRFDHYQLPTLRVHEVCGLERGLQVERSSRFPGITGVVREPDDMKNGVLRSASGRLEKYPPRLGTERTGCTLRDDLQAKRRLRLPAQSSSSAVLSTFQAVRD